MDKLDQNEARIDNGKCGDIGTLNAAARQIAKRAVDGSAAFEDFCFHVGTNFFLNEYFPWLGEGDAL